MNLVGGMALSVTALMFASGVPVARAEPDFPDVDSYTAVDVEPYWKGSLDYLTYSWGYQFTAPAGYRCRVYRVAKAYPDKFGQCWGVLPGTTDNTLYVSDFHEAHFETTDIGRFDEYSQWSDSVERHELKKVFGPSDYKPLPAGSRIDSSRSATCVVDAQMTACITGENPTNGERHGFVLSPEGNQLF